MQPQNTEPLEENTVKHERSGGESLKRKKNGLCTSEVAERAWRGRRMDSARAASVALNMKATFNTQLWTPYA
jgi:hypothetical protein